MGREERLEGISRRDFLEILVLGGTKVFANNYELLQLAEEKPKPRITLKTDGSIFEAEGQRLIKEVEEADKIVSDYLRMNFDGIYKLDIARNHRTSRALLHAYEGNRGIMDFPTISIRKGNAAVIHETTHVIAPNYNRFLAEGLAVYVQDKFSSQSVPPTFGAELHSGAAKNSLKLEDLIKETKDYFYYWTREKIGSEDARNAYFNAGSFVKFLLENDAYGSDEKSRLEKFKKLYALADKAEPKMFDIAYGKSLPEMEKEWRSYISGQKQRSEMLKPMFAINQKLVPARL